MKHLITVENHGERRNKMVEIQKVTIKLSEAVTIDLTPEQAKELLTTLKELFETDNSKKWVPIPIPQPYPIPYYPPVYPYITWTSAGSEDTGKVYYCATK